MEAPLCEKKHADPMQSVSEFGAQKFHRTSTDLKDLLNRPF